MEGKLGSIYVDINTRSEQLMAELGNITKSAEREARKIENTFQKAKLRFDDNLSKKSIVEINLSASKLRMNLERKIKLGAPLGELEALKSSLDKAENAVKTFSDKSGNIKPPSTENASRWGMIASGIQNAAMTLRDFSNEMKQLIGQSMKGAADLEVLKSAFQGSAKDLELFKKATAGTVSEAGLIKLSNQASALGLSLQQQAIFFSLAEDAADSFGGTVEAGMEGVIRASEGSAKAISSLGIEKKAFEERTKELAKAEGNSIQNLDSETQKRIRLQAIIELSGITLEQVNAKQKDAADLMESFSIEVEKGKLKLGQFLLNGLTPVLSAFDKSPGSIKNFVTGFISIGSVLFSVIPLLAQVITAMKLQSISAVVSANAINTETAAINANTIAKTANSRVSLGLLSKLGVITAVAVGVYALTQEINDNTKAIIKNREEAEKRFPNKFNTGFGQPIGTNKQTTPEGTFNYKGNLPSTGFEKDVKTGMKIDTKLAVSEIQALESKILELQGLIATAKTVKIKVQYEKELKEVEAKLNPEIRTSKEVEQKRQETINTTKTYYETIAGYSSEWETNYKAWMDKELENVKKYITDKKALQDIILNMESTFEKEKSKRLKAESPIEVPFTNQPNGSTFNGTIAKFGNENEKNNKKFMGEGGEDTISGLVPVGDETTNKHLEMWNKIKEGTDEATKANEVFGNTLASAFSIANMQGKNLEQVFGQLGAQLANTIVQALIFKGIMAGLNALGLGGALKWLGIGAEQGGSFQNGSKISKFAQGGSILNGNITKFAMGGSMMVPHMGLSGDAYPILVKGGEKVDVTPISKVGDQEKVLSNLVNRIEALTLSTIKNSNKKMAVQLIMDSKVVAEAVTRTQNEFDRNNIKVSR